jgi:hypothetical protein
MASSRSARVFYQRAEGSPVAHSVVAGDPSLRLKNGYAQDDAIDERRCDLRFKLSQYPQSYICHLDGSNLSYALSF